jgi:hypothetical protein
MSERIPLRCRNRQQATAAAHGTSAAHATSRTDAAGDRARLIRYAILATSLAALALLAGCGPDRASAQQDWDRVTASRSISGENELRVSVEYGAGTLTLGSAPAGSLYRADLEYDRSVFSPRMEYDNGRLRVGMNGTSGVRGRNIRAGELDVRLTQELPLDLSLQFGAAEANLNLDGLRVRSLELQTGASRTTLSVPRLNEERCREASMHVGAARFEATGLGNLNAENITVKGGVGDIILDFTGEWPADMRARIEMGLGSLTLRMPRGLGVRVTRSGALTTFDGQELVRRGESYYSEGFDAAARKLTVSLEAALGRVRVVWVD